MALQTAYQRFLAAPNTSFLAANASLHYITTLTTFNGSSEIIKHLNGQTHDLKKKEERFLDVIEGSNALAVEVYTTIEFVNGGGSFLPGLDDNFLADRTVTLPIVRTSEESCYSCSNCPQVHIVSFDDEGKIRQIRQHWDQGSLLKLLDVIGKTGRNWPIRDGKDQIKLITSSAKSAGRTIEGVPTIDEQINRSRGSSTNVTRDPHASLSLFAPREKPVSDPLPAAVAPRASAKPPPRDLRELFVGNESDESPVVPSRTQARERSESSSKPDDFIAGKGAGGRNYAPSRLFDNDENDVPSPDKNHSADHLYRPNPAKYKHFDFADGSDAQDAPKHSAVANTKNKHGSQWNFDDFTTPQKNVPTKLLRTADVRHWGNSDDEVADSPVKAKKVDKPRKDAATHFEFKDDGIPEAPRPAGRPRGAGTNNGMGLYKNNLYDDGEGGQAGGPEREATNLANVKDRKKDFEPHFAFTDDSPAAKPTQAPVDENRAKVVKMMGANWAAYDQSPTQEQAPDFLTGRAPLTESTNTMSNRNDMPKGIKLGGDGMGGKKGTGRSWGFGDESDGEEAGGLNGAGGKFRKGMPGKAQNQKATGGDFWDF